MAQEETKQETQATTPEATKPPEGILSEGTSEEPEVKEEAAPAKTPVEYKLSLPEGSKLDSKRVDEIVAFARERGLSNEDAQGLLARESDLVKGYDDAQASAFEQAKLRWVEEIKTDKVYGGDNYDKTVANARFAFNKFAPPELKQVVNQIGLANHPGLVKLLANIGKAHSEDSILSGKLAIQMPKQKTAEEQLYPSLPKE